MIRDNIIKIYELMKTIIETLTTQNSVFLNFSLHICNIQLFEKRCQTAKIGSHKVLPTKIFKILGSCKNRC